MTTLIFKPVNNNRSGHSMNKRINRLAVHLFENHELTSLGYESSLSFSDKIDMLSSFEHLFEFFYNYSEI
ncbi:hypothetical protein BpHYR1_047107 [Brachionus plicatilis]|uniref:Uncharacterized protein n=1 Tax=Brachionus plicatilis TaxID=10195 RepID=A0A3M7Q0J8_BRAPC|nr:hypothetical protein BpHYR1_047107 [Brachionus plicatilis]